MSGDVQPRKRKDKKKKKDDLGVEEPRGTAAALGEGDVFMHSYHDHGTGGHWCAKIIFFSLLAVLVTLIGLIILENRGLTELEANSVESRYSGVLEGWIEDAIDDHHDEHTLELKHHDDDEDHPDDQLDENEAEEESLEEEIDHNENDESNEDDIEDDETHKEDDEEEDELQNDEDELDDDDDGDDDENHSDDDDDEEDEPDSNVDEVHDEDNDDEDNGKYEEEIEESLKDDEDDEETDEQYSYEEMMKSKNDIVENGDENDDDEDEEEKKHDLSKEKTSHYNYHASYENGDDESKEMKYDDENESNEQNTEDEANEEDDQEDVVENEEEIEKIEKEIYDDSEEIVDKDAFASKEKRDSSKEVTEEDTSKEDDEPAVEKLSRPKGKPFVEIEEESPVKPVDTLAEEEAYEREQEEIRRQEEQAPHSKGGGNSLEADWPGEPSDPYWRSQLDTAEEEFRQGSWSSAAARAGGGGLAACGRARWLRARALDRAAEQSRDNRVLAEAIAAYLHLLKMNEAMSDEKLLEVARRTVDRIQFRGTYLSAEPVYRLLIRRFPDDVNYRNNLTITYLMANRADLADEVLKETLRLWPNDRVALAHHGFVLKIHHNKLEEAVRALRKALDGDAGRANEPRFHYHLGDALLMLGRFDEAHEVHRRGAELGHFLSPSQRSLYNVPRLRGRPWWRIEDTPYVGLARTLEASWRDILKEGEAAVALYEQEKEGLKERGEWSQLDIFVRGREVGGRCARAPALCAALRGAGPAAACARGQVKFSLMAPGTHVRPHVGPTNCRLRMHLALSNTEGTYLRVDKETRQWQVGKTLLFDDSFEHEVWHNGTGSRLVLIVDVWHPDLTAAERRQLPAI